MISRRCVACTSCRAKTILRVGIGHARTQEHSFDCPRCGVQITVPLRLGQSAGTLEFLGPTNAKYVQSEKGAVATLLFHPEVPVHDPRDGFMSPFLATFGRYLDFEAYQRDESIRQSIVTHRWPAIKRLLTHYRNENLGLFQEAFTELVGEPPAAALPRRRRQLAALQHMTFGHFSGLSSATVQRLHQRCAFACSKHPHLVEELLVAVGKDERPERTSVALVATRDRFVAVYASVQPLLATRYWNREGTLDLEVHLPDKAFDKLRQLYVDCFELSCTLLVPALALEAVIVDDRIEVPYGKRMLSIRELYEQDNAVKLSLIERFPIGDIFVPRLDSKLRNGLGHNAARLDTTADKVVYFTRGSQADRRHELSYTAFAGKVLDAFAALEAAVVYFDTLEIMASESAQA